MLAIPLATTIRVLPASNKADWVNVSQPNASLNHTALAEFFELRDGLLDLAGRLWFEGAVQIPIRFSERDGFIAARL